MELDQKEKDEIKVMLEESKRSRNAWGKVFYFTLILFIIEIFTRTVIRGEIGITIGGFTLMSACLIWWRWSLKKEKVKKYERLLSKVAE